MSSYETQLANHGADDTGSAAQKGWAARLKQAGTSLLPLGLFVCAVLGYEQATTGAAAPPNPQVVVVTTLPKPEATAQVRGSGNVETGAAPRPAAAASAPRAVEPAATQVAESPEAVKAPASLFEDRRNLLDIARQVASMPETSAISERGITIEAGSAARTSLGFKRAEPLPVGAYATIRGVPVNARLTHGLAIGNETWLVDGADLALVALEMRSAVVGALALDLDILAADNRQLARERIAIAVKAAQNDATATVSSSSAKPSLRLATDTQLFSGRGNLMRFEFAPAADLPDGAYILLRGLPKDTLVSRGVSVGSEVWLLTPGEAQSFEVRVPQRTSGLLQIDARLVTPQGALVAETKAGLEVSAHLATSPSPSPSVAVATIGAAPGIASGVVTRSIQQAAPAPSSTLPSVPTGKSKAALAEDKVAGNPALTRGRKMLAIGNIAVARSFLERAAVEGSGEAAALLGASFDTNWLKRTGVLGVAGDDALARRWYEEARRLGSGDIDKIVGTPAAPRAPTPTTTPKRS